MQVINKNAPVETMSTVGNYEKIIQVLTNDLVQNTLEFEFYADVVMMKQKFFDCEPLTCRYTKQLFEMNDIMTALTGSTTEMCIIVQIKHHIYNYIQHFIQNTYNCSCVWLTCKQFKLMCNNLIKLINTNKNISCNKPIHSSNVNYIKRNFMSK